MKKESIVQFVCFTTNLELDEFTPEWEGYTEKFKNTKTQATLYGEVMATRNGFRYVSKFEWPDNDFQFTFKNDRKLIRFPENKARISQMGGYLTIEQKGVHKDRDDDTTLIAFINHRENDLDYYRNSPLYNKLTIHQAYYESCTYGYVMEFIVPEKNAEMLLQYLKQRQVLEAGVYRGCMLTEA